MMRRPAFWAAGSGGLALRSLAPLGCLYGAAVRFRLRRSRPERVGVPVICIGNIVVGGAGKTPTALAVASELLRSGVRPHFLTRGYGGREAGPLHVDLKRHTARQVGDEALLLANAAPTWVARDRLAGARMAEANGADCIVMDDGFQNPSLYKDLSVIVVDRGYGFGNGRLLPAGPLREPVGEALVRAQAFVVIGTSIAGGNGTGLDGAVLPDGLPVLQASFVPLPTQRSVAGDRVAAFAGIGRPEKFFETLRESGADLVFTRSFADHHPYQPVEIMEMVEVAAELGARLLTTEKDFMRLDADARAMVEAYRVMLAFEDENALQRLIAPIIRNAK